MAINFRRAVLADLDGILAVHYAALERTNDFYTAFFKINPKQLLRNSTTASLSDEANIYIIAEADEEGIVGFVQYTIEAAKPEPQNDDEAPEQPGSSSSIAKDELIGIWKEFLKGQEPVNSEYERAANGQKHFYINHIMVHPNHQNQGTGGILLSEVMTEADKQNLPTFLVSTVESEQLFFKTGFQSLGSPWKIDNAYWTREIQKAQGLNEANEALVSKFGGVCEVERVMKRASPQMA